MKNEFRGAGKVFRFTLQQTLKSKAYVITTVLLLIASIVVVPVLQMIQSNGAGDDPTEVAENVLKDSEGDVSIDELTIHVYDETSDLFGVTITDMGFNWSTIRQHVGNANVSVKEETGSVEDALKALKTSKEKEVIVHLGLGSSGVTASSLAITVYRADTGTIPEVIGQQIADYYVEEFSAFKDQISELTDEQKKVVDATVSVIVNFTDENGQVSAEKDTTINDAQYALAYAMLFVLMMVVIMGSTQIATSITTDKSTKVVEYLLTSIRPMALVVGKVCAMLLASVGQLALMLTLVLISNKVFSTGQISVLENLFTAEVWKHVTAPTLLAALVALVLGALMYGMLAALCGASISKMEALQEALSLFTVTTLIGVYIGVAAMTVMLVKGDNPYVIFTELFPLSSTFFLPGALLIGKVTWWIALLSIVILLVVDVFVFLFVARIYEMMINHNGERIKPKEWLTMFKGAKKGGKA